MSLTRFSVAPLHTLTRTLAAVAMGRELPDQVLTGARLLSTYTERLHADREIWLKAGGIEEFGAGELRENFSGGAGGFDGGDAAGLQPDLAVGVEALGVS